MLNNKWQKGFIDGYKYWVLAFEEGSIYGIDDGRISKLEIRDSDNNFIALYDRGWVVMPQDDAHIEVVSNLISKYN